MARMTTADCRGYHQICGSDGAMMVIACDQRGSMRSLLTGDPEAQQAKIGNDMLGDIKADITRYLASQASCVLVDPVCAVPQLVDEGLLDRSTALLIGLDASGWDTRRKVTGCRSWSKASPRAACASSAAPAARSWSICAPTRRPPTPTTSPSSTRSSPISPGRTCCWSSSS